MNIAIEQNSKYGLIVGSRVIAKELKKRHTHVLRDLEKILTNPNVGSLIIISEYKDKKGELRKEYLLTKDGFILYMFNIQGYQEFKMAYIQKFNEMEKILNHELITQENNPLLEELNDLKEKFKRLEEEYSEYTMSWSKLESLKEQIESTIKRRCENIGIATKPFTKYLKSELEKEIFTKFGVDSIAKLKDADYKIIMPFIFFWVESYTLRNKYMIL